MLAATVLGSSIAFLDSTVVNVALPHIGEDLDTGVGGLQWVLSGYLLAVSSLILLGGSLGDRFGRKRVFQIGVVIFALASLWCAVAPNVSMLIVGRVLQGVGGALLTPGSLAILEASFRREDRARGDRRLVGAERRGLRHRPVRRRLAGRRGVVAVDLPHQPAAVRGGRACGRRHVPETSDPDAPRHIDCPGAVLVALGLGGISWGLISAGEQGWRSPAVWGRWSAAWRRWSRSSSSSGAAGRRWSRPTSSPPRSSGPPTW